MTIKPTTATTGGTSINIVGGTNSTVKYTTYTDYGTVSAGSTLPTMNAQQMQRMLNSVRQAQADQYTRLYQNYLEDYSPSESELYSKIRTLQRQLCSAVVDLQSANAELADLRKRPEKIGDRYLNASDLLEEFFEYLAAKGVTKRTLDQINIKLFVAWLVVRAAEEDQETVDFEAKKLLEDLTSATTRSPTVTGGASPGRANLNSQILRLARRCGRAFFLGQFTSA